MIKKSLKILHIEPDKQITNLVKLTLNRTAEVKGVSRYLDAEKIFFNRFASYNFNMIILELFGRTANDGARFMKKLKEYNINIPVIVLTLCTQTIYQKNAKDNGAKHYFTKPFLPDEFEKIVRQVYMEYVIEEGKKK